MVEAGRRGRSLREERVEGVPSSFKKLNLFLRVRKRDLADYVAETCERRFEGTVDMGEKVVEDAMEIDDEVEDTQEMDPEMEIEPSDDEVYSGDDEIDEVESDESS